jgi:hypothetical protein
VSKIKQLEKNMDGVKQKPKRKADVPVQFYLERSTGHALESFMLSKPPDKRPSKRWVFETALRRYLAENGFWPEDDD